MQLCVFQDEDLGYTWWQITFPWPSPDTIYPLHCITRLGEHVTEPLKKAVIQESTGAYTSPVVLVRKAGSSLQLCVTYGKLKAAIMFPYTRMIGIGKPFQHPLGCTSTLGFLSEYATGQPLFRDWCRWGWVTWCCKSCFLHSEVCFLGQISAEGIGTSPDKKSCRAAVEGLQYSEGLKVLLRLLFYTW